MTIFKSIKKSIVLVLLLALMVSCNTEPTLQTYFVNNSDSKAYFTGDLPKSLLSLAEVDLTQDQKKAYESVDGINFLVFKAKGQTTEAYDSEVKQMKTILSHEKYEDLMDFSDAAGKFSIKYLGDDDSVEEFIVFARNPEVGFGVVRVLGNQMNPEQLVTLMDTFRGGELGDNNQLEGIIDFLK